jgi:(2Fe-2S) ferredoxin
VKTVKMLRDFSYQAMPRVVVQYLGGVIYARVPEFAVRAIVRAGAGEVIETKQHEAENERSEL